jgi:DNA-binding NtrC family response regulator
VSADALLVSTLRRLFQPKMSESSEDQVLQLHSVLLIDDERAVLDALCRVIAMTRRSWNVVTASSGEEGLKIMTQQNFHTVVSDMSMPGLHGLSVLRSVQREFPKVTRIALTGYVDEEWKVKNATVANVFLMKPCMPDDLIGAIEHPEQFGWTAAEQRVPRGSGEGTRPGTPPAGQGRRWDDDQTVDFA